MKHEPGRRTQQTLMEMQQHRAALALVLVQTALGLGLVYQDDELFFCDAVVFILGEDEGEKFAPLWENYIQWGQYDNK